MIIQNPWKSPSYGSGRDYEVTKKPVFSYKGYHVYRLASSYLYTDGSFAFSELAGLNKAHLMSVADRNGEGFLYDRAIEALSRKEAAHAPR